MARSSPPGFKVRIFAPESPDKTERIGAAQIRFRFSCNALTFARCCLMPA
jgi:hypothetical protein